MSKSKTQVKRDLTINIDEYILDRIPILPLRGLVVFPETSVPLNVGQPRSVRLINDSDEQNK